jgi:Zn finger protein HypA/HybF involved in hydrogenase expression
MAVHTGERTDRSCTYHCDVCEQPVTVKKGEVIPRCIGCGGKEFHTSTGRLEQPGDDDFVSKK